MTVLEIRRTRKGTGGSNPSPSASSSPGLTGVFTWLQVRAISSTSTNSVSPGDKPVTRNWNPNLPATSRFKNNLTHFVSLFRTHPGAVSKNKFFLLTNLSSSEPETGHLLHWTPPTLGTQDLAQRNERSS